MTTSPGDAGLYPAEDGTIYTTFKRGDAGLPIEELLPASGRGDGFESFHIANYFDYAHLWFATPTQIEGLNKKITAANLKPGQTTTTPRVPIDLKSYRLLRADGSVENDKLKQMFLAVASFWEQADPVKPIPGLFHQLHRQGMPPHKIAATIIQTRQIGGIDSNGDINIEQAKTDPLYQIVAAAFMAYREHGGLEPDVLFQQDELDDFKSIWRGWTRSDTDTGSDIRDAAIIWQDYRRLRLIDHLGAANAANAKQLAQYILEQGDAGPDFEALVIWAENRFEQQVAAQATTSKTALKVLRKKRKAGRVNRKRGRR